jgi:methionyl-tRNA formyltransferase
MKIVFFGTPHFVIPVLESLMKKFKVLAVVTTPDQSAGRKQLLTSSPIKKFCVSDKIDIPVLTPHDFDEDMHAKLKALRPDLFVVAAYGHILPDKILSIPPFGAINVHPSLLPKYRGPTPVPATLLHGDLETGVTIIKMDEQMDHGPILAMKSYTIHEADTSETLLTHLFDLSAEMLPDVISNFTSGKMEPKKQDESKATYTQKVSKSDGEIDCANPPEKSVLDRMIRAYFPWPVVWTTLKIKEKDVRVKLLPGKILQMEGKNPVSIKDFMNGYPEAKDMLSKLF